MSIGLIHPEIGALSIVLAQNLQTGQPDPARLMVRARREEHLKLLQGRCGGLAGAEIIESVGTDYRFRIIVEKTAFATAMAEIANGIEYSNVKGRAHREKAKVGEGFVSALHRIWSTLREIQ